MRHPHSFRVETVVLTGEFDLAKRGELAALLTPAESADVASLDMEAVPYVDASALTCLIRLSKRMIENGGSGVVRIEHPSQSVRRLIAICHLDRLFAMDYAVQSV